MTSLTVSSLSFWYSFFLWGSIVSALGIAILIGYRVFRAYRVYMINERKKHVETLVQKMKQDNKNVVVEQSFRRPDQPESNTYTPQWKEEAYLLRVRESMPQIHKMMRDVETLFARKDSYAAEALLVQVLSLAPYYLPALKRLGMSYIQSAQWSRAAAVFAQMNEIDPTDADILYALGHAYYGQKKYAEAYDAYRLSVQINPCVDHLVGLATVALDLWHGQEAFDILKLALKKDPKDYNLLRYFADVAHRLGFKEDAILAYRKIRQKEPYNQEILDILQELDPRVR